MRYKKIQPDKVDGNATYYKSVHNCTYRIFTSDEGKGLSVINEDGTPSHYAKHKKTIDVFEDTKTQNIFFVTEHGVDDHCYDILGIEPIEDEVGVFEFLNKKYHLHPDYLYPKRKDTDDGHYRNYEFKKGDSEFCIYSEGGGLYNIDVRRPKGQFALWRQHLAEGVAHVKLYEIQKTGGVFFIYEKNGIQYLETDILTQEEREDIIKQFEGIYKFGTPIVKKETKKVARRKQAVIYIVDPKRA